MTRKIYSFPETISLSIFYSFSLWDVKGTEKKFEKKDDDLFSEYIVPWAFGTVFAYNFWGGGDLLLTHRKYIQPFGCG